MVFLVVEDDAAVANNIVRLLQRAVPGTRVVVAANQQRAKALYLQEAAGDLALIVMDGEVPKTYRLHSKPDDDRSTLDFVRWIRQQGFAGPMVGVSGNPATKDDMVEAGCNTWVDKLYVTQFLVRTVVGCLALPLDGAVEVVVEEQGGAPAEQAGE